MLMHIALQVEEVKYDYDDDDDVVVCWEKTTRHRRREELEVVRQLELRDAMEWMLFFFSILQ